MTVAEVPDLPAVRPREVVAALGRAGSFVQHERRVRGRMMTPMVDFLGLRATVRGRLLLVVAGIGGGTALGVLAGASAVAAHWPGAWALPDGDAARLVFLFCVAGGVLLGASAGAVMSGNATGLGVVWAGPGIAMLAYEYLGVGHSLPKGTYLALAVPAVAVLGALVMSLFRPARRKSDGGDTWYWRAAWARLRGRPAPRIPESLRHPLESP